MEIRKTKSKEIETAMSILGQFEGKLHQMKLAGYQPSVCVVGRTDYVGLLEQILFRYDPARYGQPTGMKAFLREFPRVPSSGDHHFTFKGVMVHQAVDMDSGLYFGID